MCVRGGRTFDLCGRRSACVGACVLVYESLLASHLARARPSTRAGVERAEWTRDAAECTRVEWSREFD